PAACEFAVTCRKETRLLTEARFRACRVGRERGGPWTLGLRPGAREDESFFIPSSPPALLPLRIVHHGFSLSRATHPKQAQPQFASSSLVGPWRIYETPMDIRPARLWLRGVGGLRSGYDGAQHASRSRPVCANPCAGPRDLDEASAALE